MTVLAVVFLVWAILATLTAVFFLVCLAATSGELEALKAQPAEPPADAAWEPPTS